MRHIILFVFSLLSSLFYTSTLVNKLNEWLSSLGLDEKGVHSSSLLIYSFSMYVMSLLIGEFINFFEDKGKDKKITELKNKIVNLESSIETINNENYLIRKNFSSYRGRVDALFDTICYVKPSTKLINKITQNINNCKSDLDDVISSSPVKLTLYDIPQLHEKKENTRNETNFVD